MASFDDADFIMCLPQLESLETVATSWIETIPEHKFTESLLRDVDGFVLQVTTCISSIESLLRTLLTEASCC